MAAIKLYFPNIESGAATVGYTTIQIVDHVAEVDEAEAGAIKHWQVVDGATLTMTQAAEIQPVEKATLRRARSVGSDTGGFNG